MVFFLGILFFTGCGPKVPRSPDLDFSGNIDIKIQTEAGEIIDRANGIFKVEGGKNKLSMFFDNRDGIPIGHVIVRDGDIDSQGLAFMEEFRKILEFWPYIFGMGVDKSNGKYSYKDIELKYLRWHKTGQNQLAKKVNVEVPSGRIMMNISYEN